MIAHALASQLWLIGFCCLTLGAIGLADRLARRE